MTKQKYPSPEDRAITAVTLELHQFIDFIHTIEPELEASEAIVLAAFILHNLPELFQKNPDLLNQIQEIPRKMKLNRN
ncbi:hypothetical protein [Nostoc sp. MG11]|uniref:hypothetical protein n=1 Tax=Nostoc sp. MG11 TaxID=2721166 RepID=UPI0018678F9F|nr:hypothetical protein [Nostoc sp. MG11]